MLSREIKSAKETQCLFFVAAKEFPSSIQITYYKHEPVKQLVRQATKYVQSLSVWNCGSAYHPKLHVVKISYVRIAGRRYACTSEVIFASAVHRDDCATQHLVIVLTTYQYLLDWWWKGTYQRNDYSFRTVSNGQEANGIHRPLKNSIGQINVQYCVDSTS